MSRTALATLLGLAIVLVVGQQLSSELRMGAWLGGLLGASVGLFGSAWLVHSARHRPQEALRAMMLGFLAHLGALLAGALIVRFAPVVSASADVRGFAVAYAFIAFIPLVLGATAGARVLSERTAA